MEKATDRGKEPELKYILQAKVDLFKTVATFGFLVVVLLCIGVPLMCDYATGLNEGLRHLAVLASVSVGLLVVLGVMFAYACTVRRLPACKAKHGD